ncbi:uncharacterized protein PFL1_05229 [Pseudozyma flocculosa PF-1]|uniref:Uncharacterized protein n=1 Tax=Pseudozyma flocculosa PF-1 TaxID=1277687 RepID=A0A061H3C9_9BASI|nr:uncharacterized protein PFL1_05229 [Pseudozyma flocculosa PF-1]EPQ27307.1 hypothetical protein PFL1_05229 [Pseudozyma flocculosa PF-1]
MDKPLSATATATSPNFLGYRQQASALPCLALACWLYACSSRCWVEVEIRLETLRGSPVTLSYFLGVRRPWYCTVCELPRSAAMRYGTIETDAAGALTVVLCWYPRRVARWDRRRRSPAKSASGP